MPQAVEQVSTWDSTEGEMGMEAGHEPSWQAFIDHMQEDSLKGLSVLDYGCNRGGFLRLLHQKKPYASALGVDIAADSLADAESRKGGIPASFALTKELRGKRGAFDIAFSHEVVYLLPDLKDHAREMHEVLKPGGVYYIAIGEYAENPLWERWKKVVSGFSPVAPQTYSLQDIAKAFQDQGFEVSVRRLVCDGFLPYDASDGKYLHNPMELIDFMTRYMMLFRMKKLTNR